MKRYTLGLLSVITALGIFSIANAFSFPSQVSGVRAVPLGETSVLVSWGEATSAEDIIIGYRVYYGLNSVQEEGATYDDDIFVSGKQSNTISNLIPGTTYYFAVTALDSEENESESYSLEVSTTTQGEAPVEEIPATCDDGIMNGNEEGIDCGGDTCETCYIEPEPTCDDGIMNGLEEDVDCGGECKDCFAPEEKIEEPILAEEPEVFGPEVPDKFRPAAPDLVAPIEAMNLKSDVSSIEKAGIVALSWNKSLDIDKDVVDQIVYVRKNMGNWDSGYSIGKELETIEIDVEREAMYEYKIVTTDAAGNEAESEVHSFSTQLVQSGPAGYMGIAVAIFMLFGLGLMAAKRR